MRTMSERGGQPSSNESGGCIVQVSLAVASEKIANKRLPTFIRDDGVERDKALHEDEKMVLGPFSVILK